MLKTYDTGSAGNSVGEISTLLNIPSEQLFDTVKDGGGSICAASTFCQNTLLEKDTVGYFWPANAITTEKETEF